MLATAGDDHNVLVWNAATGQPQIRLRHRGEILHLTSSLGGARLAAASAEHILIWDWPAPLSTGT
jgi:hypothetical protein